jgi:sec-independent protein translocase protein TatB
MLSLSPAKLLVVLVIMLIVLGPDKLPGMARQIGAAWHDFRLWRSKLETEVRGTFPDLPPTHEVARAVRSPLAFLDRLADEHERSQTAGEGNGSEPLGSPGSPAPGTGPPPSVGASAPSNGGIGANGWAARPGAGEPSSAPGMAPDDPSMN